MGAKEAKEKARKKETSEDRRPDVGQWARLGVKAVVLRNRTDRKKGTWLALSLEDFEELGLQPPGLEKASSLETLFPAQ